MFSMPFETFKIKNAFALLAILYLANCRLSRPVRGNEKTIRAKYGKIGNDRELVQNFR